MACGQAGHDRSTAGARLFKMYDMKPLTPKERLAKVMGKDPEPRTVKMALGSFLNLQRVCYRRKRRPLTKDEAFVEAFRVTMDDAVMRTTTLMWEMSHFLDLVFKHCRDTGLPFPKLDQSLVIQSFTAVAAPLDGELSNKLIAEVKTQHWDPMHAR
jgi:hypothetical protein